MKTKTINIVYWILNILLCLALVMDAIGGLTHNEEGLKVMRLLGYPPYIMPILGGAKLLAAIALLQPWFSTIKEWAYAGLTFHFIGASLSWAAINGPVGFVLLPLIVLAVMLVAYYFWKKRERIKSLI